MNFSGSNIVLGTYKNDDNGEDAGHVRCYELDVASTYNSEKKTVMVYPNPSSESIINVNASGVIKSFEIFDMNGRWYRSDDSKPQRKRPWEKPMAQTYY